MTNKTVSIDLSKIKINGGTQPRCKINDEIVSEYSELMSAGTAFPPIVVFEDGVDYWLADGFHRTHAARRAGIVSLPAEIHHGTKRDAILYSVGANAAHGQRRTNADKRKAVMTLLQDDEWSQWSDHEIARKCAVHQSTVSRLRPSLMQSVSDANQPAPSRTYTTKHGTTAKMNTANIGKSQPTTEPNLPKPEKIEPKSRGVGLSIAHEAIKLLHSIPRSDGLRDDAFQTVIDWIETNR